MLSTVAELRKASQAAHEKCRTPVMAEEEANLVRAHNNVVQTVMAAIGRSVESAIHHDLGATRTFVVNPHKGADLCGNTFEYVWHGYLNVRNGEYGRRQHHFAGIFCTPLEEVQRQLNRAGIDQVEDITDPEKNCELLLKVSFGLKGSFNES